LSAALDLALEQYEMTSRGALNRALRRGRTSMQSSRTT
jgi:hypothetical protein